MPNHDFKSACGYILRDQYRSVLVGGSGDRPTCPHCGDLMVWMIPVPRMDLRSDGEGKSGNTFQKFTMRDGQNNLVEIDSLHTLRRIEAESEKMAADGVGQQVRVRGFAQDASNMGVNTFGDGPPERPTLEGKRKFGLRGGASQVEAPADGSDPDYAYGPGVSDANTSALAVDE